VTLVLIAPADDAIVDVNAPMNRGWDRARIIELVANEDPNCEVVDGSALSEDERYDIYLSAIVATRRAQVKGAFMARAGCPTTLGTLVPALVDYVGRMIDHVYPMSLGDHVYPMSLGPDEFWTISDYLEEGWDTPSGNLSDGMCYPHIQV
jgi:hypothetical protein